MCSVPRQHTVHSSSDGQNPKLLKTTLKDDLWDIGYDERTLLGPRHKIVCMLKASLWQLSHGDNVQRDMAPIVRDTAWQRVWHGQVSASLLPSDSCFPLLTIAGTTCNFAKLPEKCSVTVSKYSNAARFSRFKVCGVSLSFPAPPPLCWKVRDTAGGWDESVTEYSVLTAYPLHFTPSQNVSNSRVLLRAPRPAQAQHAHHPVTSKHSLSPALFHIGDIKT